MNLQLSTVADAFLAAGLDDSMWIPALRMLADATGSARAQLIGVEAGSLAFDWINDRPDSVEEEFATIDVANPLVNPRIAASLRATPMQIVHEANYDAVRPFLATDVYHELAAKHDIPFGCQTTLQQNGDALVGLALLRGHADGRTTEVEREIFAQVAPFVRSAVLTRRAVEAQGQRLLLGGLDAAFTAAFLCNARGLVIGHSAAADRLLSEGRLSMSGGQLRAPRPAESRTLAQAIQHVAGPGRGRPSLPHAALVCHSLDGLAPPLVLDVARLPGGRFALGDGATAIVTVRGATRRESVSLLRTAYGLSRGEADVALRLAQGQSREEIAAARDVSVATVRVQIKAIFNRVGVSREAELVARLAAFL